MSDSAAVAVGRQVSWTPPISLLPRPVLEPNSALRTIVVGWLLAFPVSIALSFAVRQIAPAAELPNFPVSGLLAIFLLVVFAPVLESLIMGGMLLVLLRFLSPTWAVIACALGWGLAHSLAVPTWGLTIWWPFLIFSTVFVTWRQRSLLLAFAMPMLVHGFHNLLPALLVAYGKG